MAKIIPPEYTIKRLFQEGYEEITIRILKATKKRIENPNNDFYVDIAEDNVYGAIFGTREGEKLIFTEDPKRGMVITQKPGKTYNPEIPTWHTGSFELREQDIEQLDRISLSGLENAVA